LGIEAVGQDRLDAAVAQRVDRQGPLASSFQAGRAIALAQSQDAQAGSVALLGVAAAPQDGGDQPRRGGAGLFRPPGQAFGRPLGELVVWRHVGIHRGVPPAQVDFLVAGHALPLVERLHRVRRVAHVKLAADQGVGY